MPAWEGLDPALQQAGHQDPIQSSSGFPQLQPSFGMGESPGQATSCHARLGIPSPAMCYQQCLLRYSLPGHLQAEFEGAQVIDIHSHYLG